VKNLLEFVILLKKEDKDEIKKEIKEEIKEIK